MRLAIAISENLTLTDITAPTDGGTYDCIVLNNAGFGIDSSILFVVPYFVTHPQNVQLEQMQTLRLTCEAEGFPFPSIQWEKMNRVTGMFEAISGENSTVFMINSVAFSDFGMYRCVATTMINDVEYNATSLVAVVIISSENFVPQPSVPLSGITSRSAIIQWIPPPYSNGIIVNYTVTATPLGIINSSLSSRRKRQINIGVEVIRCLTFLQLNTTVVVSTDSTVTMINVTDLGKLTYEL